MKPYNDLQKTKQKKKKHSPNKVQISSHWSSVILFTRFIFISTCHQLLILVFIPKHAEKRRGFENCFKLK